MSRGIGIFLTSIILDREIRFGREIASVESRKGEQVEIYSECLKRRRTEKISRVIKVAKKTVWKTAVMVTANRDHWLIYI